MKRLFFLICTILLISPAFSANSIIIGVRDLGNNTYQGVIANLEVTMNNNGTGHVFIDTMPLTEIDTQTSARLARDVACETLLINCSDKDFYYVIRGEFPMIGGPSAGAAMSVLTMSELANTPLIRNTAMTGTVNPDGSVGPIGGVLEKAIAASEYGITIFLIPVGQGSEIGNYTFQNNMRIIEVSTVREAYSIFTGTTENHVNDTIDFASFNEVMAPMAERLINYSNTAFDELNKDLSSNNTVDQSMILLVNQTISQREETIYLYNNGSYYSAASYAVGSSVSSLYIKYYIEYLNAENKTTYLNGLFSHTSDYINQVELELDQPQRIDNINDIEAVNTAIDRLFEAKELYNAALEINAEEGLPNILYNLAFVEVRLKTAESWITLKDVFTGSLSITLTQDSMRDFALQRLDEASTMITYSNSLLYNTEINTAQEQLDNSRKAYNEGNYIYSIFESLRAISNSNLAIEMQGISEEQLSQRINLSKQLARENINSAQNSRVMPILALSYYEYSGQFEDISPQQTLMFLEYAKQFAKLSTQMAYNIAGPLVNQEPANYTIDNKDVGSSFVIIFIIIILAALVILYAVFKLLGI
ncbi:Archaeal Lon protease [Candidatus Tiddalikarchaeum anstoanum]|nr:Archaeal Lon protease [Candidatus Tiddalikarchaeum anstoanum]